MDRHRSLALLRVVHCLAVAGAEMQRLALLHDYRAVALLAACIAVFHKRIAREWYFSFLEYIRPYSSSNFRARMHVTYSRGWL